MNKLFYLIIVCLTVINIFGQVPDTILIETTRIKGFGPFETTFPFLNPIPKDNPWFNCVPEIKGIPTDLDKLIFATEQTDFMQYTYQSYYGHKISEEHFNECKNDWNWQPYDSDFTKEHLKLDIAVVAGYNKNDSLVIKVDINNNYDLSDESYFTLPEKLPGQNFWGRYNDNLPFEVEYEYYDGKSIKQAKTWTYLDYSPMFFDEMDQNRNFPDFVITFPQHYKGEFYFNGKKYFATIKSDRVTFRSNYNIKIWESDRPQVYATKIAEVNKDGFIKLDDYYYRFAKASIDGSQIILVKDKSAIEKGGNQVGFKAIDFSKLDINGNLQALSSLKGEYILLDFWGTWCSGCREDIPKLKSLFETYKDKNFEIIGIANDEVEKVRRYVNTNEIKWPQIVESKDKSIIVDYNIISYPTNILIDPEGNIIERGLRAPELEQKLSEIFKK